MFNKVYVDGHEPIKNILLFLSFSAFYYTDIMEVIVGIVRKGSSDCTNGHA